MNDAKPTCGWNEASPYRPPESEPPVRSSDLLDRWEVQRHDMLREWNTWVIYDKQHHAETECARRISESPERAGTLPLDAEILPHDKARNH